MNSMRTLMQICSPDRRLVEDAAPSRIANLPMLNQTLRETAPVLAKLFGLQWDMDWSNRLTAGLKQARADYATHPENRNRTYDPVMDVFRCAEAVYEANQFGHVEGEHDDDANDLALGFQASLASSLAAVNFYNVSEFSRVIAMLSRVGERWGKITARTGGRANISPTFKQEMQRLVPMMMTMMAILDR